LQLAWITADAMSLIEMDALKWSPRETGGPLFGYENCGELVITRAYLPGHRAFHAPWLYKPDRQAVQMAIDDVYEETHGQEHWIGSWHSHPLARPIPSWTDQRTARRIATEPDVNCPEPVMLIQATKGPPTRQTPGCLGAFRYSRKASKLQALELRSTELRCLPTRNSLTLR
jgi:integrative and conjugative element protein (TIGR02256 family)